MFQWGEHTHAKMMHIRAHVHTHTHTPLSHTYTPPPPPPPHTHLPPYTHTHRLFPPTLKEHISHDIVLMCVSCHQLASQHDAILKAQIAMEHGAPVNISTQKFNEDPKLLHVRNHARWVIFGSRFHLQFYFIGEYIHKHTNIV